MAIVCAQCGLKNPNSAVMCDCGLVLRAVDGKTLAGAERAHQDRQSRGLAKPVGIGVGAAVVIVLIKVLSAMLSN